MWLLYVSAQNAKDICGDSVKVGVVNAQDRLQDKAPGGGRARQSSDQGVNEGAGRVT